MRSIKGRMMAPFGAAIAGMPFRAQRCAISMQRCSGLRSTIRRGRSASLPRLSRKVAVISMKRLDVDRKYAYTVGHPA